MTGFSDDGLHSENKDCRNGGWHVNGHLVNHHYVREEHSVLVNHGLAAAVSDSQYDASMMAAVGSCRPETKNARNEAEIKKAQEAVNAWTALDVHRWYDADLESHWWYPFVDGWAHTGGKDVYEGTRLTDEDGKSNYIDRVQAQYERFKQPAEFLKGWTTERILQLNLGLRHASCGDARCSDGFIHFKPRGSLPLIPNGKGPVHNVIGDKVNSNKHLSRADKRQMLTTALANYTSSVGNTTIAFEWKHPRRAMGATLRPLATLFAVMAEIHPFPDANSRTRNFVLQAEVTRLGGHPLLIVDFGWRVYSLESQAEVELFILRGWCAWKSALDDGVSPYTVLDFKSPDHDRGKINPNSKVAEDLSVSFYDEKADVCIPSSGHSRGSNLYLPSDS